MAEEYGLPGEARQRRRRLVITVVIVALAVFFAVWYAMSYVRAEEPAGQSTAGPTSTMPAACDLSPGEVSVNVYNSTSRDGLAGRVAEKLEARGFVVKKIANDPKQMDFTGPGQLRHGTSGAKGAKLLAEHVAGFESRPDERGKATVDVVLGAKFDGLVPRSRLPC